MESFRSLGAMLVTAPSEQERCYQMAVRLGLREMRPMPGCHMEPWVRLTANIDTGDVCLAAGIKVKHDEDDGA
jgi:hypothetical protein